MSPAINVKKNPYGPSVKEFYWYEILMLDMFQYYGKSENENGGRDSMYGLHK